jgi:hypothetical protein
MATIGKCEHKNKVFLPSRSLVDLPLLSRPSAALHNELQFGGPRGPRPHYFKLFLTMATIAHAITVDAGPFTSHGVRRFYPNTYSTSSPLQILKL